MSFLRMCTNETARIAEAERLQLQAVVLTEEAASDETSLSRSACIRGATWRVGLQRRVKQRWRLIHRLL
jgi:hypothetical protein